MLRYANLTNSVWERCTLASCSLAESALAESRISKTVFQTVDLTGAELFRTPLRGLDLTGCTLDRVIFSETCAELKGAKIAAGQAPVVARILGITVEP